MGSDSGSCSEAQPCKTIGRALNVATAGTTIQVGRSKYKEQVNVSKKVRLVGIGKPIIDATGLSNGIVISGDAAQGTVIEGFVVRGADNEGILIKKTADVTVRNNVISYNNRGMFTATPSGACAPQGDVPGDCGGGLHLLATADVNVLGNIIRNNAGGILVTDELGPSSSNLISGNLVLNNLYSSGIKLSGHATGASTADGGRDIGAGGVFSNVITQNVLDGNGLLGIGGGVLLEATADGTAVYDNNVALNTAVGNGLAGVTLRRTAAAADTADNQIVGNVLAQNGLRGGPSGPGDSIAGLTQTVGIVLYNVSGSVAGIAVSGNTIIGSAVGIWTLSVAGVSAGSNTFAGVGTPVISR
jgi:parallel beta-helix repeat protein